MSVKTIEGKTVKFENRTQIMNMGGPWIGELHIENEIKIDNVILDNLYFNSNLHKLYFVRYHPVSKWQKDNFFNVYCLDWKNDSLCRYDMKFEMIYIESVSDDGELIYFKALHDKNPNDAEKIKLNDYICIQVDGRA